MTLIWEIEPMGAPRTVRSDTWRQRPVILRYHRFRDWVAVEMKKIDMDWSKLDTLTVDFYLPMSKTWSKKKKDLMFGKKHQQKPDIDNLVKAVLDSIFRGGDDAQVSTIHASKYWSESSGYIKITL